MMGRATKICVAFAVELVALCAGSAMAADHSVAFSSILAVRPINEAIATDPGNGYSTDNAPPLNRWFAPVGRKSGFRGRNSQLVLSGYGYAIRSQIDFGAYDGAVLDGNGPGELRAEASYVPDEAGASTGGIPSRLVNTDAGDLAGTLAVYAGGGLTVRGVGFYGNYDKTNLGTLQAATKMAVGLHVSGSGRARLENCGFRVFADGLRATGTANVAADDCAFDYSTHAVRAEDTAQVTLRAARGLDAGCVRFAGGTKTAFPVVTIEATTIACNPRDLIDGTGGDASTGHGELRLSDVKLPNGATVSVRLRWDDGVVWWMDDRIDARAFGLVAMEVNPAFDNAALLNAVIGGGDKLYGRVCLPAGRFGVASTLNTMPRQGLIIEGVGAIKPAAENQFTVGSGANANPHGGPATTIVWIGAAGGTVLQINGPNGELRDVAIQGQYAATNADLVTYSIDYDLGADIGIFLRDCDVSDGGGGVKESDWVGTPPYASPGFWTFHNLQLDALRTGMMVGANYAPTNHADHCAFTGRTGFNWCDTGFWLKGGQSVQFTFEMVTPLQVKTVFHCNAGGQLTVYSGRIQGVSTGSLFPTWLYVEGADVTHGRFAFHSLHADGNLTNGFRLVDYTGVNGAGGLMATIEVFGFSTDKHGLAGLACGPIVRMGGPMKLTMHNGYALEEGMFELHPIASANWQGNGATTTTPRVTLYDCQWSDLAGDPQLPTASLDGDSTGGTVKWVNGTYLSGVAIADGEDTP